MTNLPHYANMRDGALVSLQKPASQKMVDLTKGLSMCAFLVAVALISFAVAVYPEPIN